MKNISILQIKSACQRGNPKTYFLTLVDRAQDEGRSTRSGPPLPAAAAVAVRWLLFWQPGIFQFGTQDDGARSLCKFISSFLTQQHYQAQDWRPPTSDLQPPATTMMMPMMEMLHLCTRTYICMYIHTYLLVDLLPGSVPGRSCCPQVSAFVLLQLLRRCARLPFVAVASRVFACLRSAVSCCTRVQHGVYAISHIGQYCAKLRAISRSWPSLALCIGAWQWARCHQMCAYPAGIYWPKGMIQAL